MNIKHIKLRMLTTLATGALLACTMSTIATATEPGGKMQSGCEMNREKMPQLLKFRPDKFAARLEIKASQQAAWYELAKSVETLADRNIKEPVNNEDAAAVVRRRPDEAGELAKNLNRVADATGKLQSSLTEDQCKLLNQNAHRFLNANYGWKSKKTSA